MSESPTIEQVRSRFRRIAKRLNLPWVKTHIQCGDTSMEPWQIDYRDRLKWHLWYALATAYISDKGICFTACANVGGAECHKTGSEGIEPSSLD